MSPLSVAALSASIDSSIKTRLQVVTHDGSLTGSGTAADPLAVSVTASIQSFSYTANGSEGTEFTVPLPVAMPSPAYLVLVSNASSGSMVYHQPASTRTTTNFRVSVSVPPANGEEFDFFVASQGSGGAAIVLSGSGGGLSSVSHDWTLSGDGTSGNPLSATPLSGTIDSAFKALPRTVGHELFGTGIDGDLTFDGSSTILGVTASAGGTLYTMNRDIMARNVTVNSGIRLWMANYALTVQRVLTNNGTIQNNGNNGFGADASTGTATAAGRYAATKPANGQNIGINSTTAPRAYFIAGAGGAANGGSGHAGAGDGGGGGADNLGNAGFVGGSTALITDSVVVDLRDLFNGWYMIGGNGSAKVNFSYGASGGAGGLHSFNPSGIAGAGGGMLWVAAQVITGSGNIRARGGNGSGGDGTGGGGGGGGGGGMVVVVYGTMSGQTVDASGGIGGTPAGGGSRGGDGGSGSVLKVNLSGDGT